MKLLNIFKNRIYKIDKNGKKKRVFFVKGLKIKFKGKNSTIILHQPITRLKNCQIVCGNSCFIEIKSSEYTIKKLSIMAHADNSVCKIGENFSCTSSCKILLHQEPNLSVLIDDNCMFGTNIMLRTTDAHTICDSKTKEILNYGKSIKIGKNCWLAMNVTILKGVSIADGCVIGTHSLVTKDCNKENSIYVGNPAKLKKTDIIWDRKIPSNFISNN